MPMTTQKILMKSSGSTRAMVMERSVGDVCLRGYRDVASMACWNSRSRPPPDHRRASTASPSKCGSAACGQAGKRSETSRDSANARERLCAAKRGQRRCGAASRAPGEPIPLPESRNRPHVPPLAQIPLRFRARALRRWFATGRTRAVNERRTLRRAINCDCVRAGGLETVQIVGLVIPTHPSPHPSSPPSRCSRTRNSPRRPSKA